MRINRTARWNLFAAALLLVAAVASTFAQVPPQVAPGQGSSSLTPTAPGDPGAGDPAEPPTPAELKIDEAIKNIEKVKVVSADLVQDVKMLGQSFQIKGRYLKAPVDRVYLRLDVDGLPGSVGTLLQVSDGDVLWDYQKILDSQSYRKLSVKPITERLNAPEVDKELRNQIRTSLGFAGPEALLAGIRQAVRFDQLEEGELDGKAVWIVKGGWRDRAGLSTPDQRPVPMMGKLPSYIPSFAIVHIDKTNGWPYRVELKGRPQTMLVDTRQIGLDGTRIGSKSSIEKQQPPSELILVYSNTNFAPTLTDADFAFQAPQDQQIEDNTDQLLQMLNQALEAQALQKRIEAATAAESVLQQPIDVPAPSPAAEIPR